MCLETKGLVGDRPRAGPGTSLLPPFQAPRERRSWTAQASALGVGRPDRAGIPLPLTLCGVHHPGPPVSREAGDLPQVLRVPQALGAS